MTVAHVQHGRVGLAVGYLVASLAAGVAAAVLGMALARGRVLPVPRDRPVPDPDDLGPLSPGPGADGARS